MKPTLPVEGLSSAKDCMPASECPTRRQSRHDQFVMETRSQGSRQPGEGCAVDQALKKAEPEYTGRAEPETGFLHFKLHCPVTIEA
jgi:hypothetical protein